jgi:hypothetical protein
MRLAVIVCLALIASACGGAADVVSPTVVPAGESDPSWAKIGKSCSPASPAYAVPRIRLDSAPTTTHGPGRTVDDEWSDIARDTPGGFAGLILENGVPVVFLTDTTKKADALAALTAKHVYSGNLSGARVRAARWNFMQLAEWFRYFQLNVYAEPGLTSADIDEAKNRITFGVRDSTAWKSVEALLSKLDVPCYLVGLQVVNISLLSRRASDRQHLVRPAVRGNTPLAHPR